MLKKDKPYWIKERHNPQLGVYYVPMGQMSKTAAGKIERGTGYGDNFMLRFETLQAYRRKLSALKKAGAKVRP